MMTQMQATTLNLLTSNRRFIYMTLTLTAMLIAAFSPGFVGAESGSGGTICPGC